MNVRKTALCLAGMAIVTFLAACDDSSNKGSYRTHGDNEQEQDDEWQQDHCRKNPRDC
jgi:hypothetical protein